MRMARVLGQGESYYHLVSRVVDRRMVMDETERARFVTTLRAVEGFCAVQVLTFAVLGNHWHILLRVPERRPVSDAELLERLAFLYSRHRVGQVAVFLARLRAEGRMEEAEKLKGRFTYRMYDLSQFVKALKQRYSISYNARHGRKGTLWEERFRSVLVEGDRRALWVVAAYIDLNAVRAGLVKDPQRYRYCGYGEAVAGRKEARAGLMRVMGSLEEGPWARVGRHYRRLLYMRGESQPGSGKAGIAAERVNEVLAAGGALGVREALHCRVRYFTDGLALGGKSFVEGVFMRYRENFGLRRKTGARPLRGIRSTDLFTARQLRLDPIRAG